MQFSLQICFLMQLFLQIVISIESKDCDNHPTSSMFPRCDYELSKQPDINNLDYKTNSKLTFVKTKLGTDSTNKNAPCTEEGNWNVHVNQTFGDFCKAKFSPNLNSTHCILLGLDQDVKTYSPQLGCVYLFVTNNVYSQCYNKFYIDCLYYSMIPKIDNTNIYLTTSPTDILTAYKTNWSCNNGATVSEYCTLYHWNSTLTTNWLKYTLNNPGHFSNVEVDKQNQ